MALVPEVPLELRRNGFDPVEELPETAVALEQLSIDPSALGRAQEAHQVRAVLRHTEAPERRVAGEVGLLIFGHPSGVGRPGVDRVGGHALVGELAGGGQDDSVHGALARPVGEIPDGVVAGQADDSSGEEVDQDLLEAEVQMPAYIAFELPGQ